MKQLKQQVKQETNADTKQDTKQDTRQDTRQETKQETIKQSVFHKLTDKISGYLTGEMKALKPFRQTIDEINVRRERLKTYNDDVLQLLSADLRKKVMGGVSSGELLADGFALACEASRRLLGLNPFDVQVAAAIAMHHGHLAQMQTGEGKTLAAVLPAYLNGLSGKGVHILTFNDYLARRDAEWMGPVYRFLGLSVAYIQEGMSIAKRQDAYNADVVYITAKEAGFDFLRDQRCLKEENLVQRPYHYVIVDEADSILIDEARVPLVIAGEAPVLPTDPYALAQLVKEMKEKDDYCRDEYSHDVNYTDKGMDKVETLLGYGNLHNLENNGLLAAANLALQAEVLLKRDADYIVRNGRVELVDEFTGRVAENRRWPYGLQTAIEAKEGLDIQPEGKILGTITLQHFLRLYGKLAGMTATAKTSEKEFDELYDLKVVEIPPNRPCIRVDHDDMVFADKEAKLKALVQEIKELHSLGRPILVGTATVEESEHLANELKNENIPCRVLNAKNDEAEAAIVAEAGALGAVTISTNMAGRGTDIRLGGKNQENRDEVVALGGLFVIGTNRHESRRIDDQLRGRSGRQGDPGDSRFIISLQDDLMVRYRLKELIPEKHQPKKQDSIIRSTVVTREIARAQRIIENQNFSIRKLLRKYSFIVEEQRKLYQQWRKELLLEEEVPALLALSCPKRYEELTVSVGVEVLERVEKEITLFHMDECWTEHLDNISHIREGVHLWTIGGKDPSFEFHKLAIKAFDEMRARLNEKIVNTFKRVNVTADGIDAEGEGLTNPSSTWTYLVDDNPFEMKLYGAMTGSTAFAFGASIVLWQLAPILLLVKLISYLKKRKK